MGMVFAHRLAPAPVERDDKRGARHELRNEARDRRLIGDPRDVDMEPARQGQRAP
jgi:hypothetical protein